MIKRNPNIKIGIDFRMSKHTGIGRYISGLVKALKSLDFPYNFVLFGRRDSEALIEGDNRFSFQEVNIPIYSISEQLNLPRIFRKENLDLLHVPHYNIPVFYKGKIVVTVHDLSPLKFIRFFDSPLKFVYSRFFMSAACRKANRIISVSRYTKNDVVQNLNVDSAKIDVIYEALDDAFVNGESVDPGTQWDYILYVGLVKPHKNILKLIKAFASLKKKERFEYKLIIAGKPDKGYLKLINKEIRAQGLRDQVIIKTQVDDNILRGLYKKASLFVLPSLNEGFGLPILEALSFGVPVVASNVSSIPEVLGDAGLYFDPYDINDIAEKMKNALMDDSLSKITRERAARQLKKFSWKKAAKETIRAYEECCL